MQWDKRAITAILIFSFLRLIIASLVELGNDESYYWLYSQKIQWNYFDHPAFLLAMIDTERYMNHEENAQLTMLPSLTNNSYSCNVRLSVKILIPSATNGG